MRKSTILLLFAIFVSFAAMAGTVSTVSIDRNIVEVSITAAEGQGIDIDDVVLLKGKNDEFSVKGIVQAKKKNSLVISVDFGLDMLTVNSFVKVFKRDEEFPAQKPAKKEPSYTPGPMAKTTETSIGAFYWMSGDIELGTFGITAEKPAGFVAKFSYDSVSADGNSFGLFIHYAPTVELEWRGISDSGTMTEVGLSLKTILNPGSDMLMKPGLNLGYRTFNASNLETVTAFGVNASLQMIPQNNGSKAFFDVGFLTQPNGGNSDTTVTFGPILYLGGGLFL